MAAQRRVSGQGDAGDLLPGALLPARGGRPADRIPHPALQPLGPPRTPHQPGFLLGHQPLDGRDVQRGPLHGGGHRARHGVPLSREQRLPGRSGRVPHQRQDHREPRVFAQLQRGAAAAGAIPVQRRRRHVLELRFQPPFPGFLFALHPAVPALQGGSQRPALPSPHQVQDRPQGHPVHLPEQPPADDAAVLDHPAKPEPAGPVRPARLRGQLRARGPLAPR